MPCRVLFVVLLAVVAGACNGGSAGPTGKPETVLRRAPDITLAGETARVVGAAPGVTATGVVTFATGVDNLVPEGLKRATPPFGVTEPAAVLDLLRGVVSVESYGGVEVQGEGAKRYEVDIDLDKAITATPVERRADLHKLEGRLGADGKLWADVFVDGLGRVRRVLLPVRTDMIRPYGDDKRIAQLVSVDYSDFGETE